MKKPRIVLCNKIDVEGAEENAASVIEAVHSEEPDTIVIPVSVMNNTGMGNARNAIIQLVNQLDGGAAVGQKAVLPEESDFMKTRSVDEDMEIQYPGSEK